MTNKKSIDIQPVNNHDISNTNSFPTTTPTPEKHDNFKVNFSNDNNHIQITYPGAMIMSKRDDGYILADNREGHFTKINGDELTIVKHFSYEHQEPDIIIKCKPDTLKASVLPLDIKHHDWTATIDCDPTFI